MEYIEDEEKEPNTECIICGKKYYVCGNCKETTEFLSWRTIADNPTCYKIFMTLNEYLNKSIDKQEAKRQLTNTDLSKLDTYADWVQFQIENITK